MIYAPDSIPEQVVAMKLSRPDETGREVEWTIFLGPTQLQANGQEELAHQLNHQWPVHLVFKTVEKLLLKPRLHWMKLFITRMDDKINPVCFVDNKRSEETERQLSQFEWPQNDRFGMFRQFIVLLPTEQIPESSRVPLLPGNERSIDEWPGYGLKKD